LVNCLNGGGPLSDGSRHSLDRATPRITGCEDAGPACLEIMGRPICRPLVTCIRTCQHKPVLIQGDTIAKPSGIRLGSKKKENVADGLVFDLPLPVPPYRLQF
jgi:hypothetical protein